MLIGCVALLLIGTTPTAGAASDENSRLPASLMIPGITVFDISYSVPIRNGHFRLIRGTRQAGGACAYAYQTPRTRPGVDPVPASRTRAEDRAKCLVIVEEGSYAGVLPVPLPFPTYGVSSGRGAPVPAAGGRRSAATARSGVIPQAAGWDYGYEYNVRWFDCCGIEVSEARPYVLYNTDPNTITACAGNTSTWWNTSTGWQEISNNINVYYGSGNTTCTSDGAVHHYNPGFPGCGGQTDIYYNPARITGYRNGTVQGSQDTYALGCTPAFRWDTVGPYNI